MVDALVKSYHIADKNNNITRDNWLREFNNIMDKQGYSFSLQEQHEMFFDFIWYHCIEYYGNYGTSPESGWIEKKKDFDNFMESIEDEFYEMEREEHNGENK